VKTYEFWTNDWAQIKLHGKATFVALIPAEQCPEDLWDMNELTKHNVVINSIPRRVVGIEMFRHYISPEQPYRKNFGIAVIL